MDKENRKQAVDLLKQRYSCRKFKTDEHIDDETMNDILEVGLNAAAGGNIQAVSIVMVKDQKKKDQIYKLLPRGFVKECDALVFYVLDYNRMSRWSEVEVGPFARNYSFRDFIVEIEDVMCVAQSIECAATLMGVGSVYMAGVNMHWYELKEILNLPKLTVPILLTCMGIPDLGPSGAKKYPRDVLVHEEEYHVLTDEEVTQKIVNDKYDNSFINLTEDNMEEFKKRYYDITCQVNGEEWAKKVVDKIDTQGGINKAQFQFCDKYNPLVQHGYNEKSFSFLKEQGIHVLPGDDEFRKSSDFTK